jgi:mono/diheme cytochrome c family protein
MRYPFFDFCGSYAALMAGIAVVHVFISHFAIGGGLFLVVNEHRARRAGDTPKLQFLERLSKFFVVVTLIGGTLTGVGIWFVIGVLNPAATEALIHNFVWVWATEWTFFAVEILAALVYFYGWKRMPASSHLTVGWIYFAFAWLSLFAINGIITFMLTPGRWLATGNMWDAFFNPTFWPSLAFRTCVCAALAGLYGLLVVSWEEPESAKPRLVRGTAVWAVLGLAASIPALYWYWRSIPAPITLAALDHLPVPVRALHLSFWLAAALAAAVALSGLIAPRRHQLWMPIVMLAAGLVWFGSFEWFRESIRMPYVIPGYMYGNGVAVADAPQYRTSGYLAAMEYRTGNDAADLFRHACRSCHTMEDYNALKPTFDGTDRAFIAAIVRGTHLLRGTSNMMPPFLGSAADADAIAGYIDARVDHRPVSAIYGVQGARLGEKVFQLRCGKCHVMGGAGDKSSSLAGLSEDDDRNLLDNASDMGVGMPAFTASPEDREALIQYLKTLKPGGSR